MWTSDHVFAALQLRSAGQGSKEETDGFVVIRYDRKLNHCSTRAVDPS
jgi:hypothetical protein